MKTALYQTNTGGNCTALTLDLPQGFYMWFTDADGTRPATKADHDFIAAVYADDGETWEPVEYLAGVSLADAIRESCNTWGREYPENLREVA